MTEEAHLARRVYRARLYRGKVARITAQTPRNGASGRRVSFFWGGGGLGITQWFHNENICRDHVGIKPGGIIGLNADSYFSPFVRVFVFEIKEVNKNHLYSSSATCDGGGGGGGVPPESTMALFFSLLKGVISLLCLHLRRGCSGY